MKATKLEIPEVMVFEPQVFHDDRGLFFESFNQRRFEEVIGRAVNFVQDNHSISRKGVLRGMHFQRAPFAQGKLVRVVRGAAFDVAVDLRNGSTTYGKWVSEQITADNRKQVWIPEGFAHGFLSLIDGTELIYKTTAYYDKDSEGAVSWKDFGIRWPMSGDPITSPRDAAVNVSNMPVYAQ